MKTHNNLSTSESLSGNGALTLKRKPRNSGSITTITPNAEWPRSGIYKAFIGIDNGFSGAIACLLPDGNIVSRPVGVKDLGNERLLDEEVNPAILREMLTEARVERKNVLAVYEQCQPNPIFGARNNFTNGKNGEFWRMLLSFEHIPFRCVNPQQWQRWIFRGIRGKDTKAMANLVRRQRFPTLDIEGFNKPQLEGINDAVCIALWASELSAWASQTQGGPSIPSLPQPIQALGIVQKGQGLDTNPGSGDGSGNSPMS